MEISQKGINFIKREERFVSKPYLDIVGVPTIGYGTTCYENGVKVKLSDQPVNESRATGLLTIQVNKVYAPAVEKALRVKVNQNQFDALVSFAYNVGTGGMAGSTLLKKINASINDSATITTWFGVWNKGTVNGKKVELKGLTLRRKREADLFLNN